MCVLLSGRSTISQTGRTLLSHALTQQLISQEMDRELNSCLEKKNAQGRCKNSQPQKMEIQIKEAQLLAVRPILLWAGNKESR